MKVAVKRIFKWLFLGLCALAVVAAGLWGFVHTERGRSSVADFLSASLSSPEMSVSISGLDYLLPHRFGIENLSASDEHGEWLAVEGAFLRWDPWSLFRREIRILELGAAAVHAARAPDPSKRAEKKSSGSTPLYLLESLSISSISFETVRLDEPVIGTPLQFKLNAFLTPAAQGREAAFAFDLERMDGPGGHAKITASVDASLETLAVDGRIWDPAGGIVSSLTGRPTLLEASISGSGPLSDWSGQLKASGGDLGKADLEFALKSEGVSFKSFSLEGSGEATVGKAITGRPADDSVRMDFRISFAEEMGFNLKGLTLVHRDGTFTGRGIFGQDTGTIDGAFSISIHDIGELHLPVALPVEGAVHMDGTAVGDLMRPQLDVKLTGTHVGAYDFAADRLVASISAVFHREADRRFLLEAGAGIEADGVVFPGGIRFPEDAVSVKVRIRVTPEGFLAGEGEAGLGSWLSTEFRGGFSPEGELEAFGNIEVSDLSKLSNLANIPLAGASTLDFSIHKSRGKPLAVGVKGSSPSKVLTELAGRPWPGGELGYRGNLTFDEDGFLHLTNVAVADSSFNLSGKALLQPSEGDFSGNIELAVSDLSLFSSVAGFPLSGAAGLEMKAEGKPAEMKAGISLKIPGGSLDGHLELIRETMLLEGELEYLIEDPENLPVKPFNGRIGGKVRLYHDGKEQKAAFDSSGSGISTAFGSLEGIEISGQTAGLFPPRQMAFSGKISGLEAGDLRISSAAATGSSDGEGWRVTLDSEGVFRTEFSSSLAAVLRAEPGSVLVEIEKLSHVHGGIPVKLDRPARVVSAGKSVSIEGLSVSVGGGTLRGSALVDGTLSELEMYFDGLPLAAAGAAGFDAGTGFLSGNVSLSPQAEEKMLQAAVLLQNFVPPGPRRGDLPAVEAEMSLEAGKSRLAGSGEVRVPGTSPLAFRMSMPVEFSDGNFPGLAAAGSLEGSLTWLFDLADLQSVGLTVPGELSGEAELQITLDGSPGSPEPGAVLHVKRGAYRDPDMGTVLENIDVSFSARTISPAAAGRPGRFGVAGMLSGLSSSPFEMEAELPIAFSMAPFSFGLPGEDPLRGFIRGYLDLAMVPAALSLDRHYLDGLMSFDLDLNGTMDRPLITGTAEVSRGYFEDIQFGTVLENISLQLDAAPPRISVVRGEAQAGRDGKVTIGGWLELAGEGGVSYSGTLEMLDAEILRRDDIYAVLNGELNLSGAGKEASVNGDVQIDRAQITIPDRTGKEVPKLEIVEIHDDTAAEPRVSLPEKPAEGQVTLDLTIQSPGRLFVSGRGLESEWKGRIQIEGRSPKIHISGDFSLVRGYFNLLGRRFALVRGTIHLGGAPGSPPIIDVVGEASSGGMTAQVVVSGPASSLSIDLSSNPPYPSDEILSRILFGRSLTALTPLQALQLAQAAQTLTGGGGLDILGQTRRLMGIDQLELMQSDDYAGEASIRAGKYISDRIYLQVEQGIGSDRSKASVEIELTPNLSLESEVGADTGGGVGIKWRWDY